LVLPALRVGAPGAGAASPVMIASLIERESVEVNAPELGPIPPAPPSFSFPAPSELLISFTDEAVVESPKSNEFSPPRLRENEAPSPIVFASRAGIDITRAARVILTVTVTDEGTAGEVAVTISSGNSKLDLVAIEYVRALRWDPAIVQGRQSSMNIRLPVVFAIPG
jgi:TonB family protein